MSAPATAAPEVNQPVQHAETFLRVAQQFGLPLVMLAVFLWWAKNDVMMPLLNAHFEVVDQIVRGQEEHTEGLRDIGEKLDELIRVSR